MKKWAVFFFLFLTLAPVANAEITRIEYLKTVELQNSDPDSDHNYEYKLYLDGLIHFNVYIERWKWVPHDIGRRLTFKERILLMQDAAVDLKLTGISKNHDFSSLVSIYGSSSDGTISYETEEERPIFGKLLITSKNLEKLFPGAGKGTKTFFGDAIGVERRMHGTFGPQISDTAEKEACTDEYGCEYWTEISIWGNDVVHLTDKAGRDAYGKISNSDLLRLKRQGFQTIKIGGHVKGKEVQLRSKTGAVLLETNF